MRIMDSLRKKVPFASSNAPRMEQKDETRTASVSGQELAFRFLSRPHVSEKAGRGSQSGVYVFEVKPNAEKIAIKKAVEAVYHVRVRSVRTLRSSEKPVRRGRISGRRPAKKKAIVTLAPGQTIQLYEGV